MVHVWEITIPQLSGEQTRRAYIYLPASYDRKPAKRYPVLYMFDGHNVFYDSDATYGTCWGMKEYMDRTKTQLIIVAIECNHDPDQGRLKEYAPFNFTDDSFGEITGLGQITMDWYVKELKPAIDSEFRTIPDRNHTFIAGSSMGGLMSLYALLDYNHIFSKAAALSPSLWTNPDELTLLIHHARIRKNTVLYMDYGSKEFKNHDGMQRLYADVTHQLMETNLSLTSRIVPNGSHCEASWRRQVPYFMHILTYH